MYQIAVHNAKVPNGLKWGRVRLCGARWGRSTRKPMYGLGFRAKEHRALSSCLSSGSVLAGVTGVGVVSRIMHACEMIQDQNVQFRRRVEVDLAYC